MAQFSIQNLMGMLGGGRNAAAPSASEDDGRTDLGGLLGGARDNATQETIGKAGMRDAQMSALLALGTQMLAASGYSDKPISTGQALAAGIKAAQQQYAQSLDNSLDAAAKTQLMKQRDMQMQRQKMLMGMAQGMLGGAPGAPAAPGAGPAPGGAPAAAGPAPAMGGPAPGQMAPPSLAQMPQVGEGPQMPEPAAAAVAGAQQTPGFGRREAMAMTLLDPEHAAAYENIYQMQNPELKQLADGTIVDMRDQSLIGQSRPQLDNGMVRDATGRVQLAPGYLEAQGQLQMQKAYAEKSQDLVQVVVPGQGTMMIPRAQLGTGVTLGPNGQPQLSLGGPNGFMSQEDPASLEERKGNVQSFLKARDDAIGASRAAGEELNSLDNVASLLAQTKPGLGQTARYQLGRVLDQTGLAKGDESKWVANAAAFQMAQKTAGLSVLKSTFGGNPTEGERKILLESLGDLDTPQKAVQMRVDIARVAAERKQAYAEFLQNYDGDRAKFEHAWRNSGEGSKSVFDYPSMWKHLPVMRGKAGTPAAGKTFVRTPRGAIYPVQVGPDGTPQPIGE